MSEPSIIQYRTCESCRDGFATTRASQKFCNACLIPKLLEENTALRAKLATAEKERDDAQQKLEIERAFAEEKADAFDGEVRRHVETLRKLNAAEKQLAAARAATIEECARVAHKAWMENPFSGLAGKGPRP